MSTYVPRGRPRREDHYVDMWTCLGEESGQPDASWDWPDQVGELAGRELGFVRMATFLSGAAGPDADPDSGPSSGLAARPARQLGGVPIGRTDMVATNQASAGAVAHVPRHDAWAGGRRCGVGPAL